MPTARGDVTDVSGAGADAVGGALLGALAGDCIGAPYEGAAAVDHDVARRRVERSLAGGRHRGVAARVARGRWPAAGRRLPYTDDTQLTLALIDHLVGDDDRVQPELLARRMLARYEDWRGYGAGMRRLVSLWRRGTDVTDAATAVFADGSYGNGAAMRVAPVALRWAGHPEALTAAAARSARVTHRHPIGIDGAVVQAHAVATAALDRHFAMSDLGALPAATIELRAGLETATELDPATAPPRVAARLGTAPTAHRSVPAALWCAATTTDVTACVTRAVALGGDTDTIASMAAAVRGAAAGRAGIPDAWADALEGYDEVVDAAERLHARCLAAGDER